MVVLSGEHTGLIYPPLFRMISWIWLKGWHHWDVVWNSEWMNNVWHTQLDLQSKLVIHWERQAVASNVLLTLNIILLRFDGFFSIKLWHSVQWFVHLIQIQATKVIISMELTVGSFSSFFIDTFSYWMNQRSPVWIIETYKFTKMTPLCPDQ